MTMRAIFRIVLILLMLGCSRNYSFDFDPSIALTVHDLWDSELEDVEDWRILYNPRKICFGPDNDLLITDTGNQRILQVTENGEYVRSIGRSGDGPGEFRTPVDVLYDRDNSHLMVLDRSQLRLSMFLCSGDSLKFIQRLPAEYTYGQSRPRTEMAGDKMIWHATRTSEQRISLYRLNGTLVRSFGDSWVEPFDTESSIRTRNAGRIHWVADDVIAWVWDHRPEIELWTTQGILLQSRVIDVPEFMPFIQKYLDDPPQGQYPVTITHSCRSEDGSRLYIATTQSEYSGAVFFEIDSQTLEPLLRFTTPDDLEPFLTMSFCVRRDSNGTKIYAINAFTGKVMVFLTTDN